MIRRRFIAWCAGGLYAALGLALLVPGVAFLLSPLRARRRGPADFVRVAALDALPAGKPVRLPVYDERVDAFTRYPRARIGEVWLVRRDDNRAASGNETGREDRTGGDFTQSTQSTQRAEVTAYQVICPHLGCGIEFSAQRREFSCPCHTSAFALTGESLSGPSPRGMDPLETRLVRDDAGRAWVEVRFQTFRTGTPQRQSLT